MAKTGKKISAASEVVTRDYTVHLRKLLHGVGYKKRAPRAVKEVKSFAKKMMGTEVRNACSELTSALEPTRRRPGACTRLLTGSHFCSRSLTLLLVEPKGCAPRAVVAAESSIGRCSTLVHRGVQHRLRSLGKERASAAWQARGMGYLPLAVPRVAGRPVFVVASLLSCPKPCRDSGARRPPTMLSRTRVSLVVTTPPMG